MQSLWSETVQIPKREFLQGNISAENVVIGAGMAGLLIAYFLQKKGKQVIVLEAAEIAGGQTRNTTAKLTSQHGLIYHKMKKKAGIARARGYAMANESAIAAYEELIREEGISCDFERLPSFLYTTDASRSRELEQEARTARELGISAEFADKSKITELPFQTAGAVCFRNQAQFHPLKLVRGLCGKLTIYENTRVLSVSRHKIVYESGPKENETKAENRAGSKRYSGTITAENIIFAAHYPFVNVPGFYFLRQHQKRSYVLAVRGQGVSGRLSGMYYSIDRNGLSFRCAEGRLLLGGGSHRTGKAVCGCRETEKPEGYSYLRKMRQQYYPMGEETAYWSAQDCMPHDGIPFIGSYSSLRPYWYVATGFQKWGMTSAMVAAMLISDKICGIGNPYEKIFTPRRLLFRAGIKNLCMDIGESAAGLSKGLFSKRQRRCRHMGCRLVWNAEEQSFDCPCHGSRFSSEGALIDNPAQRGLE